MSSDRKIQIRIAQPGDEEQISRVHIQSWQEAYQGLLPQDYLDQLPATLDERIQMWQKALVNPNRWTTVALNGERIIGFILFGSPRDSHKSDFIELGALYLLASEQRKKIGFSLLKAGFERMKELGHQRAYCWVLENNPTIRFYERSGARPTGESKEDEIGGIKFRDLAYQWDSLDFDQDQSSSR